MKGAVGITLVFLVHETLAQMGFGGGGYCASCAMKNHGSNSPGFGFGGGSSSYGVPATQNSAPAQTSYGSTVGDTFGYSATSGQTAQSSYSSAPTYSTQFTIPTSICPTGKCNCNAGLCNTCSSCGWNKVQSQTQPQPQSSCCLNGIGSCCNRQFNSYETFKPWNPTSTNNGFQATTFTVGGSPVNAGSLQPLTLTPTYGASNAFNLGSSPTTMNYGSFSSYPKTTFDNFNQYGSPQNQPSSTSNVYGSNNNQFGTATSYNVQDYFANLGKKAKA